MPPVPLPQIPVGLSASMDDVLRSVRRFFGMLLPEPWDIQYQRDENMDRPCGVIVPAAPTASTGSAYIRDSQRDFDVFLYPTGFEGQPARSRLEAEALADSVKQAIQRGLVTDDGRYSYSYRLPVFDHTDVDFDEDVLPDAVPFDHLPVSNVDIEPRIDPDDDTLFTVVVGLRVQWSEDGDTSRHDGIPLQEIWTQHV